jgi:hypothetical protein
VPCLGQAAPLRQAEWKSVRRTNAW